MNVNSPSNTLWDLIHGVQAALVHDGFCETIPPFPAGDSAVRGQAGAYEELQVQWGELLDFGQTWPSGQGSQRPKVLLLSPLPLSDSAMAFVRSWFENPKVKLTLEKDLYFQPLPHFSDPTTASKGFIKELARLLAPKVIFSLGPAPAQQLLGAPLSSDSLRATDYRFDAWSIVTTLDPEDFGQLEEGKQNAFKGAVWKDLQRLLGKVRYG